MKDIFAQKKKNGYFHSSLFFFLEFTLFSSPFLFEFFMYCVKHFMILYI